ncbi:MAG: hypothetical protein RLO50_02285 [Azospirillaceae bacterium]
MSRGVEAVRAQQLRHIETAAAIELVGSKEGLRSPPERREALEGIWQSTKTLNSILGRHEPALPSVDMPNTLQVWAWLHSAAGATLDSRFSEAIAAMREHGWEPFDADGNRQKTKRAEGVDYKHRWLPLPQYVRAVALLRKEGWSLTAAIEETAAFGWRSPEPERFDDARLGYIIPAFGDVISFAQAVRNIRQGIEE